MSFEANAGPNFSMLTLRFMATRQWDRALAAAFDWLAKEPENVRAHRAAAQALVNLERLAEAEKHLEKVLAGNPNDAFAHRLMAMVQFGQGRYKLADASIRKAISLNPRDAYHWHYLALMSFRQRDFTTAKQYAEKARELNPRDAEILNLVILCEPGDAAGAAEKIRRYEEALALDPENAAIHNNIGVQYLDQLKDYAKAEECFRRALFFKPSSKLFRKNLFITVKHRDLVYRILRAPRDFLFEVINAFSRLRKNSILLYILAIPVWLLAFRFIIGGLILWFALVWPLTKVYEYLTIGDIRARAGEIGVRRGGFLGYRRWPLKVRLAIFAVFLAAFWGSVALLFIDSGWPAGKSLAEGILGLLLLLGIPFFIGYYLKRKIHSGRNWFAARRRARRMKDLLSSKPGEKIESP